MIGQIKKNEYTTYAVYHIASEGDTYDLDTELKGTNKLTQMTDGLITEDGCIASVKLPTRLKGEKTRELNLRHANALEELANALLASASNLRDPNFIYEDELSE